MLARTCDAVISSVTQQITHYSDFITLIEEKLRLSVDKDSKITHWCGMITIISLTDGGEKEQMELADPLEELE